MCRLARKSLCPCTVAKNWLEFNYGGGWTFPLKIRMGRPTSVENGKQTQGRDRRKKGKRKVALKAGKANGEKTAGRELCIVCVWLDAMGQRLLHAFMNAYFKQSPSWANLYCSPEWGCWLKANYTLQIWPLVKTLLIWHGLDSGLGACLWASAPDSHAHVSTNQRGIRRQHAGWMFWGLCLQWQNITIYKQFTILSYAA